MPSDTKSSTEYVPLLGLEVKGFYQRGVVPFLIPFFLKQINVIFDVRTTCDKCVVNTPFYWRLAV